MYFEYTPGDTWKFDEVGMYIPHRQQRRLPRPAEADDASRVNGFYYTMERHNGQIVMFLASGRPNFWGTPNKPRLPRVRTVWFNTIRDVVG